MHFGTAGGGNDEYAESMQLQHYKAAIAAVWVLAVCAAGLTIGVASPTRLAILTAIAVLPLVLMMRMWQDPVPSMSERIHDARR